jgi:hypothetical protein
VIRARFDDAGTTKQTGEEKRSSRVLCAAAHRRNAIGQLKSSVLLLSLLHLVPLNKNSIVIA